MLFIKCFGESGFNIFDDCSSCFSYVGLADKFVTRKIKAVRQRFLFFGKESCTSHTCQHSVQRTLGNQPRSVIFITMVQIYIVEFR